MKCRCKVQDLAHGLSIVNHAVSSRSTLPILANILLSSDQGRLKLLATNLEIGTTCWIDVVIEEGGTTTVPAKLFTEHITSLSQMTTEIELSVAEDTHIMVVKSLRGRSHSNSTLRGMNPEDFPSLPTVENSALTVEFDAVLLKEVIKQVVFAADDSESRPIFTAVQVQLKKRRILFAAADSFRLVVREVEMPEVEESDEDILIPARTLEALARILPATGIVQMIVSPDHSQVLFHTEQIDFVSRLLEGSYPNIHAAIQAHVAFSEEAKTCVLADTQEFAGALKSSLPFARDSSNITCFEISSATQEEQFGQMMIEAVAEDVGCNVSTMNVQVRGPGVKKIIFNCKYMAEVLAVLDCQQIAFELTSSTRPGVIKPVGDLANWYTYLVMPMTRTKH